MKIKTKLAKEAILNKDGLNHLQVELIPPKPRSNKKTKPNLMIIVEDRSGSMRSPAKSSSFSHHDRFNETASKMDYAINAATKFVSLLDKTDLFGLVSFDDMAFVDQPLTHVNADNINQIVNNIRQITPRGCTNISDALITARKLITEDHTKNYNCKIILVSDGQANVSITDRDSLASIAMDFLKDGITVSALGVGVSYDSGIMDAIATSGGGLFYHIEDVSLLEKIFAEELQISNKITAKSVKLILEIPDLIEVGENMNSYSQLVKGESIEVYLGDIHNRRKVLFEIRNNFVDHDVEFKVKVQYKTLKGIDKEIADSIMMKVVVSKKDLEKAKENKDVIDLALALTKSETIIKTSELYDKGDKKSLKTTFASAMNNINNLLSTYGFESNESDTVLSEISEYDTIYSSDKADKSFAKKAYAENRIMTRK